MTCQGLAIGALKLKLVKTSSELTTGVESSATQARQYDRMRASAAPSASNQHSPLVSSRAHRQLAQSPALADRHSPMNALDIIIENDNSVRERPQIRFSAELHCAGDQQSGAKARVQLSPKRQAAAAQEELLTTEHGADLEEAAYLPGQGLSSPHRGRTEVQSLQLSSPRQQGGDRGTTGSPRARVSADWTRHSSLRETNGAPTSPTPALRQRSSFNRRSQGNGVQLPEINGIQRVAGRQRAACDDKHADTSQLAMVDFELGSGQTRDGQGGSRVDDDRSVLSQSIMFEHDDAADPGLDADHDAPFRGAHGSSMGKGGPLSAASSSNRSNSSLGYSTALESVRRLALAEQAEIEPSIRCLRAFVRLTFIVVLVMSIVGVAVVNESAIQLNMSIDHIGEAGELRSSMVEMRQAVQSLVLLRENLTSGAYSEGYERENLRRAMEVAHRVHTALYLEVNSMPAQLADLYASPNMLVESIVALTVTAVDVNLWEGINLLIAAAARLVTTPLAELSDIQHDVFLVTENSVYDSQLFESLGRVIVMYQQVAERVAARMIATQAILMATAVGLLMVIVFCVFPPVIRHVNQSVDRVFDMFLDIKPAEIVEMQQSREEVLVALGVHTEAGGMN